MKKLFGLILALLMATGIVAVATYASFTDSEPSTGNQWTAGTLNLTTNNTNGVSQTLSAASMSPGDTVTASGIALKNTGNANGATLDIAFSYAERDGSPNDIGKTAAEVAAVMQVTVLTYDGTNLLTTLTNTNASGYNDYIDVQDLTNAANVSKLIGLSGLNAGISKPFVIAVKLRSEISNDFQADGIIITMTFTLKQ